MSLSKVRTMGIKERDWMTAVVKPEPTEISLF